MPIYEYQCEECGFKFEAMQSISAKPLKKCELDNCKGKVVRLVSASGFILKGGGWYATDYPSENRKNGWEKESNEANSNGAASEKPAAEAPAPKSPPKEKKT